MAPIFFYGRLCDRHLLEAVLGRAVDPRHLEEASADGCTTVAAAGREGPALVPAPGRRAQGVLLHHAAEPDVARLTFFTGSRATLQPIAVTTASGSVEARCYRDPDEASTPAEDWNFAIWSRDHLAVEIEAVREYMDHFGSISPEQATALWSGIRIRALQRVRAPAEEPVLGGLRSAFGPGDVEQVSLARTLTGFLAVRDFELRHRRFDGDWTGVLDRTVVVWGDAVSVLPYDPRRDEVLLIEQFRPAPWARGDRNPWCIEVVAGRLDKAETPEQTARREAVEEAGVTLGRIERIAAYYPTPGVASEHVTSFVGEADLAGAGGNHGLSHEQEDIRTIVLGFDAAMAALEAGAVNTGIALTSLLWLATHRERLRAAWGTQGA